MARVVPEDDCLVFLTKSGRRSYNSVWDRERGRAMLASRVVIEHHFGPPPEDKPLVIHSCDNPPCVLIEHLRYGTSAENTRDMVERRRNQVGGAVGTAKLTEADVRAIRADPRIHREVAEDFGIDRSTVGRIKRGRDWKHIE